ncbi:hypothetical protein DFH06DRAFT_1344258 [Mycena polygramma]|nr:hypothetical protein DFH06DRAFT_1344258 [Mycena polygramma]
MAVPYRGDRCAAYRSTEAAPPRRALTPEPSPRTHAHFPPFACLPTSLRVDRCPPIEAHIRAIRTCTTASAADSARRHCCIPAPRLSLRPQLTISSTRPDTRSRTLPAAPVHLSFRPQTHNQRDALEMPLPLAMHVASTPIPKLKPATSAPRNASGDLRPATLRCPFLPISKVRAASSPSQATSPAPADDVLAQSGHDACRRTRASAYRMCPRCRRRPPGAPSDFATPTSLDAVCPRARRDELLVHRGLQWMARNRRTRGRTSRGWARRGILQGVRLDVCRCPARVGGASVVDCAVRYIGGGDPWAHCLGHAETQTEPWLRRVCSRGMSSGGEAPHGHRAPFSIEPNPPPANRISAMRCVEDAQNGPADLLLALMRSSRIVARPSVSTVSPMPATFCTGCHTARCTARCMSRAPRRQPAHACLIR